MNEPSDVLELAPPAPPPPPRPPPTSCRIFYIVVSSSLCAFKWIFSLLALFHLTPLPPPPTSPLPSNPFVYFISICIIPSLIDVISQWWWHTLYDTFRSIYRCIFMLLLRLDGLETFHFHPVSSTPPPPPPPHPLHSTHRAAPTLPDIPSLGFRPDSASALVPGRSPSVLIFVFQRPYFSMFNWFAAISIAGDRLSFWGGGASVSPSSRQRCS